MHIKMVSLLLLLEVAGVEMEMNQDQSGEEDKQHNQELIPVL